MPGEILITGSGALACLFAARLAAAGPCVTMLGTWPQGLQALRRFGVRLWTASGDCSYPVKATDDPAECRGAALALVLNKSWQTDRVAAQLRECLGATAIALTLQNGLGNLERLQKELGAERVALGSTTTGATLLEAGRVRPGGEGTITLIRRSGLATLCEMLRSAGFSLEGQDDPAALLWGKLVINAAINPLTALLRVPNGELLNRPDGRALLAALASETAAVARASGVRLPFEDPVAAAENVARRTAANHSSMFQDLQRGAPTEIDAICGAVVRAGLRTGTATPLNETMWRLVKASVDRDG